ncbi:hypothetical protein DUI87_30754 [Hirundo rustica rustica]|uniref:Reverse transcriptase domain-containing protein n=1 Tax=Hirundo rustica rustica TaxID=333673 RepID=A0A3M0IY27_HIRRU|nr:hypothetical protein DUI87_30754 [Hirundo rustica rustica]
MQNNSVHVYTSCHREEKNQKQSNSIRSYAVTEKGTKSKAMMSVSTQAVTEEKETKGAIIISTQTVTEAEQPKPVAVAPIQKKKSKSKSVRIVTDEDVAGPLHPAEEREPEIITCSLPLGELCDLRREFTRQTNESILTWLLHIWDAAANDTILDGSEARQLGSLSQDVVIDQGIGRTQQTLSFLGRLLTSVRDRYLCKEDPQVHQGKWGTIEQDYLRNGNFKAPKGYRWAFGIAAVETEDNRQQNTLPSLSDDPSAVGLLRVEEQQPLSLGGEPSTHGEEVACVPCHPDPQNASRSDTELACDLHQAIRHHDNSVIPIHEMIRKLKSQGVVSKARSPFNSPIWPERKSSGEWRLTVGYRALNEVTPPLSAAMADMLELQYELESKAAKSYATIDIANAFFSIPSPRRVCSTPGTDCPRGGSTVPPSAMD